MQEKENFKLEDIFTAEFLYKFRHTKLKGLIPYEEIYVCKSDTNSSKVEPIHKTIF